MVLDKTQLICLDCETTGLDPSADRIIEVAAVRFTIEEGIQESFETLIDPEGPISEASMAIHHISEEMIRGKPKIAEVLPEVISFIGNEIVVGHGVALDLNFLASEAKRHKIPCSFEKNRIIDTLRLARLYGESPTNSLEMLRRHFNIAAEGAHRAMSDVIVNVEVFKQLSRRFKTVDELLERLKKPIPMKKMPLGKYKGRSFNEIPIEYLQWAANQNFDQDLLFSIRSEIKRRKKGDFASSSSPFASL